jgi:acylphosphatase
LTIYQQSTGKLFPSLSDLYKFEIKMEREKVLVDGKVQGVGYRYFVHQTAKRLNINGYVKNIAGGAVEIDAEGEPEELREFLRICNQGPEFARVDLFQHHKVTAFGYTRFRIMHNDDY